MTADTHTESHRLRSKLAANFGWLGMQKIAVILIGMATTGLLARYLGPTQSGVLASAQALAAMFGLLALGVDATVFYDQLHRQPQSESAIMGGTTAVLAVCGLLSWLLLAAYLLLFCRENGLFVAVALVSGLRLLITFPAPVAMWFQSQMHTRDVVVPNMIGVLVLRGWQCFAAALALGVAWVAFSEVLSLLFIMVVSFAAYARHGKSIRAWTCDWSAGWEVMTRSVPAIIAGTLAVFLNKLDVLMLSWYVVPSEVGYYSTASSLTESLLFLGGMTASVFTPVLLRTRERGGLFYSGALLAHLRVSAFAGWVLAAGLSLTAALAVWLVFGDQYGPSATILRVHAFMLVPSLIGATMQCHLTLERRLKYLTVNLIVALALNAALNSVLIPAYGGVGAAVASILAATTAHVLVPLLLPTTRVFGLRAAWAIITPLPDITAITGPAKDHEKTPS